MGQVTPKVSVIIPTYNCYKYLPDAIESVLNQTFDDLEIIIIDDGSIDNTKLIVEKFIRVNKWNIRYFFQENNGQSAARNKGIKESQGEYIAFLDADDIWLPFKLANQLETMEKIQGYNACYSKGIYIDSNGQTIEREWDFFSYTSTGIILNDLIFKGNFIIPSTFIYKKALTNNTLYFNESYKVGEDYDFFLNFSRNNKVYPIDEILIKRRFLENSISRKYNFETHYKTNIDILENIISKNNGREYVVNLKQTYARIQYLNFELSREYLHINNKIYAREALNALFKRKYISNVYIEGVILYILTFLPIKLLHAFLRIIHLIFKSND